MIHTFMCDNKKQAGVLLKFNVHVQCLEAELKGRGGPNVTGHFGQFGLLH